MKKSDLAKYIESTNLKIDATRADIEKLCSDAIKYDFYGVCVAPKYVELAKGLLDVSEVKVVSVVGFPLGTTTSEVKSLEAMLLANAGADEIDVVMNVSALIEGDLDLVYNEIMQITHDVKIPVKVIIESAILNTDQILTACELCVKAGAKIIKTSTGFNGGASEEAVRLIASSIPSTMGVKASGGIKDLKTTLALISDGATRIGTSNAVSIIEEMKN